MMGGFPGRSGIVRTSSRVLLTFKVAYLVVDKSPLLQELVHAHDSTHISSQVPSACSHCEVLCRVQSVCVDHEITVVLVDRRSLAPVAVVEELGKCLLLNVVNSRHVEPCAVGRQDDSVILVDQMCACRLFDNGLVDDRRSSTGRVLHSRRAVLGVCHFLVFWLCLLGSLWLRRIGRVEWVVRYWRRLCV